MEKLEEKVDCNNKATTDESKACAKLITDEKGKKYFFVKADKSRNLFNPLGFATESSLTLKKLGRPKWDYLAVNEEIYGFYVRYLETKNGMNLRHAQRRIIAL
jgi:hypothetical protein